MPLTTPLKTHGGKHYLAKKIVQRMPRHVHYVEPFAGGLSVLLARDPLDESLWLPPHKGVSELVNDIDGRLINFWRVLQGRDTEQFEQFRRIVEHTPLGRPFWEEAHNHQYGLDAVADAVAFFVDCRQSLAGRRTGFTAITRTRTRRMKNGNVSEWASAKESLLSPAWPMNPFAAGCI
jgi:DNA adenine methylase